MNMGTWTPRHLRRVNKGGQKDRPKQMAFRAAAQYSKQFINQSASFLERASVAPRYAAYKAAAGKEGGNLRKGS